MNSRTILLLLAGLVAIGVTSPAMAVELTVISGSGGGTYTTGANVPIVADAAPIGESFIFWVGDVAGVADVNAASTTITMGASDAEITAISIPLLPYQAILREGGYEVGEDPPEENLGYIDTMCDDISLQFTDKTQDPLNPVPSGGSGAYWLPYITAQLDEAINFTDFDQDFGGVVIECWGDMLNLLTIKHPTTGANLVITKAELIQTSWSSGTAHGLELTAYRMLTKWIYHDFGDNEYNIYSDLIDTDGDFSNPGGDIEWATSPDTFKVFGGDTTVYPNSFGELDYDANNGSSIIWICWPTGLGHNAWDVTDIVRTMYDVNDNQGFCLRMTDANYSDPGDGRVIVQWMSSEYIANTAPIPSGRPQLVIQYAWDDQPGNPVHLTVVSGSGDGWTAEGIQVEIAADPAPTGLPKMFFAEWVGDTGIIDGSSNRASTCTVTMGASDATLTATYGPGHILTVLNPSFPPAAIRTYEFPEGTVVPINTGAPPELAGKVLAGWVGDVEGILELGNSIYAESTEFLMQDSNSTITATYDWKITLTVDYGEADDYACVEGQPVGISADDALVGYMFSHWSGDVANVENVISSGTTITMPDSDVLVQANFTPETFLTVVNGKDDSLYGLGIYPEGGTAVIAADIPPTGQMFSAWTGDIGTIDDANSRVTTITMDTDRTVTATYVDDGIEEADMAYKTVLKDAELKNIQTGYPTYVDFRYSTTGLAPSIKIALDGSGLTHNKGILEFDISDVDAVDSVKLWIFAREATMRGGDSSLTVYRGEEQFTEAEMTWFDKATGVPWTTPGGDYNIGISASGSASSAGWHPVDVTNLYNAAKTAGQDYLSLVITRGVPGSSGTILLATKEYDDGTGVGSNAAQLRIDTVPAPPCVYWPGDLNEDEAVDIVDLNMVLIDWGKSGGAISDPRSDGNGDGTVDIVDLNLVLIDWGKTGCQP